MIPVHVAGVVVRDAVVPTIVGSATWAISVQNNIVLTAAAAAAAALLGKYVRAVVHRGKLVAHEVQEIRHNTDEIPILVTTQKDIAQWRSTVEERFTSQDKAMERILRLVEDHLPRDPSVRTRRTDPEPKDMTS